MYVVIPARQFKKSLKKVLRRDKSDENEIKAVILKLQQSFKMDSKHQDHKLLGDSREYRECHVKNDLLLKYRINTALKILYLADIGNHQDFFGK